jgi:acyl carrier protein
MSENRVTIRGLKELIVKRLNLEGVDPGAIGDDEPLFGDGFGLDSVDALELVVALEQDYGLRIQSHEIEPEAFSTVARLFRFIQSRGSKNEGSAA